MLKGIRWRIWDGQNICIWSEPWIPLATLFMPLVHRNDQESWLSVYDLIDVQAGAWRLDLLQQLFLPFEVDAIAALPISTTTRPKQVMWHYESKGAYTVKSGYRLAVEIWRREKTSVGASTSEGNLRF